MSSNDLLVVGAGHLGTRIAKRWRQLHSTATIVGETKTKSSHAQLREAGITPVLAGTSNDSFPNVVFCVPPRGDPNYKNIVEAATKRASRRFIFTSSTSVHAGAESITEDTPARNEGRASFLYQAEEKVLQSASGLVVRLSGLYLLNRGPHTFWLSKGVVSGSEESMVNLIHYDDAAAAMVCTLNLQSLPERRTFLIAAPESLSRRAIVECALKHPEFAGAKKPEFLNDGPAVGKSFNGEWSNQVLGWHPTYPSFEAFMELDAERVRAARSVKA